MKNLNIIVPLWIFVCFMAVTSAFSQTPTPTPCTGNAIQIENCQYEGTHDWEINPAFASDNQLVVGYASKTSVNIGEQIRFHIRANPIQTVYFDIYRLGYYHRNGARLVHSSHVVNVATKPIPVPNGTTTGIAECNWISEATAFWDVPLNAVSGVYLAKLRGSNGNRQSYIPFVVRNDTYNSPILFKVGVNTHQAYNHWPGWINCIQPGKNHPCDALSIPNPENGKSLYPDTSGGPPLDGISDDPPGTRQARKVSFNRPYAIMSSFGVYDTLGIGFVNYEYPMIRWLEKEGYDVTYITDIDAHNDPEVSPNIFQPGKHKVMLSVGHDEYWSWEMRRNVQNARDNTTELNIAFFSGNNVYWQVRLENSSSSGTYPANSPGRTLTSYKETARHLSFPSDARDPYFNDTDSSNDFEISGLWRKNTVKVDPAEDELVGVMTIPPEGDGLGGPHQPGPENGDFPIYSPGLNQVVFATNPLPPPPQWLMAGTTGQTLYNLIGYESDELYNTDAEPAPTYPNHNPTIIVARSPFHALRGTSTLLIGTAETTFYTMTGGAKVFAASGQNWAWGVDNWGADSSLGPVFAGGVRVASLQTDAQRITRNIIDCFSVYTSCGI